MKLLLVAAASLAVVSCASLSLEDLEFHEWKLKFGKSYKSPEEEAHRKDIWLSTRRRVLTHNILADQGIETYHMGMNQFSDMSNKEFRQTYLLKSMVPSNKTKSMLNKGRKLSAPKGGTTKVADAIDWRTSGCVTDVKNQGPCGSCWAFSASGALESFTCINFGRLPSLSEQQLVDCSWGYRNEGCNGGWPFEALSYVRDNGGIDTELSYPYEARDDYCRFDASFVGGKCYEWGYLYPGTESGLQYYVASLGPASVCIDVDENFQSYRSGIFYDAYCSSTETNHAVLAVGYGTEGGQDYWLVKNSWGESWGESGYIRMARNWGDMCGIASQAVWPLMPQGNQGDS